MIDYRRRGVRVRAHKGVRAREHWFVGTEEGVIVGESDNGVGRLIVSIEWDGGNFGPLFPEEIDCLEEVPRAVI